MPKMEKAGKSNLTSLVTMTCSKCVNPLIGGPQAQIAQKSVEAERESVGGTILSTD